jgi:hypothetical protein
LAAIAVGSCVLFSLSGWKIDNIGGGAYSHGEQTRFVVLQNEVLVVERLQPIDTCRSRAISIQEVTSLAHKIFDLDRHKVSTIAFTHQTTSQIKVTSIISSPRFILNFLLRTERRNIRFDGIYSLYTPAASPNGSLSHPYRTDGNSRRFWGPRLRRARIGSGPVVRLIFISYETMTV